ERRAAIAAPTGPDLSASSRRDPPGLRRCTPRRRRRARQQHGELEQYRRSADLIAGFGLGGVPAMTRLDAVDRISALLRSNAAILLDFDGPITRLMPPPANAELAEAARKPLRQAGIELPGELAASTEHLAVLRFAATQSPELVLRVDTVCTTGEVEAAQT